MEIQEKELNSYEKYGKNYYLKNKEKYSEYRKKWIAENPERAKELQQLASKRYYERKKIVKDILYSA